jgi:hypothetical protein
MGRRSASQQRGRRSSHRGGPQGIKKLCDFFDAKRKDLRAPEILTNFGGALTKSADRATSMRTGGAIPLTAYTPPGAIEAPRRIWVLSSIFRK